MISKQIKFSLDKRRNVFCEDHIKWALTACFDGLHSNPWTITSWEGENEPSNTEVEKTKDIIMRSFEFYHNHLRIPSFDLTEQE